MMTTYTNTWGKKLKVMVIKEFTNTEQSIFLVTPDFEEVSLSEIMDSAEPDHITYSEEYHIEGSTDEVKEIYLELKNRITEKYPNVVFNPQKYYISLRSNRNFVYIKPLKTKMNLVIMTPIEAGHEVIQYHTVSELGESVQNFYNGSCYRLSIREPIHLDEVMEAISKAYERQ